MWPKYISILAVSCMVDCINLIWNVSNFCCFIFMACFTILALYGMLVMFYFHSMVDHTSLTWIVVNEVEYFCTCIEVCVSLSCLLVYEPPYQNYSSVLQSRFHHSRIDHRTIFLVRVGLSQAHPNNVHLAVF